MHETPYHSFYCLLLFQILPFRRSSNNKICIRFELVAPNYLNALLLAFHDQLWKSSCNPLWRTLITCWNKLSSIGLTKTNQNKQQKYEDTMKTSVDCYNCLQANNLYQYPHEEDYLSSYQEVVCHLIPYFSRQSTNVPLQTLRREMTGDHLCRRINYQCLAALLQLSWG